MEVRSPQTADERERMFHLRWRVLRAPWGEPPGSERDAADAAAEHALIQNEAGELLAVGRLHFNTPQEAQIRYMAVEPRQRGAGLGRRIVEYLEAVARERGATTIVLNAREDAAGFYRTLGYETVGAGPTLFGSVVHERMQKRLG